MSEWWGLFVERATWDQWLVVGVLGLLAVSVVVFVVAAAMDLV